jgi:glycosyltransferase involved in cell wall biosynthesis
VSRRSSSFALRRIHDAVATVCTVARLLELRRWGGLDCAYLYVAGQHWTPLVVVLHLLLRAMRVPVILELNELPWTQWDVRSPLQRLCHPLDGVDGVVVISRYLEDWVRRESAARRRRVEVVRVPILVDLDEEPPTSGTPDSATLLFAGDVSAQNLDVVRLIGDALEVVWTTRPDCRFTWVGADPLDPRLAGVLPSGSDGAPDRRVDVLGVVPRDALLAMYRKVAALLLPLPSDRVSVARFPTKLGEYLASRRPVITTAVGEVGRYLTDGETAFVCPPGDAEALAAAICRALGDPQRAARVGEAGYRVAEEQLHYARHAEELAGLVLRCVGSAGR